MPQSNTEKETQDTSIAVSSSENELNNLIFLNIYLLEYIFLFLDAKTLFTWHAVNKMSRDIISSDRYFKRIKTKLIADNSMVKKAGVAVDEIDGLFPMEYARGVTRKLIALKKLRPSTSISEETKRFCSKLKITPSELAFLRAGMREISLSYETMVSKPTPMRISWEGCYSLMINLREGQVYILRQVELSSYQLVCHTKMSKLLISPNKITRESLLDAIQDIKELQKAFFGKYSKGFRLTDKLYPMDAKEWLITRFSPPVIEECKQRMLQEVQETADKATKISELRKLLHELNNGIYKDLKIERDWFQRLRFWDPKAVYGNTKSWNEAIDIIAIATQAVVNNSCSPLSQEDDKEFLQEIQAMCPSILKSIDLAEPKKAEAASKNLCGNAVSSRLSIFSTLTKATGEDEVFQQANYDNEALSWQDENDTSSIGSNCKL